MIFTKQFGTFLVMALLLVGCGNSGSEKEELIIFHAGSLSVPLRKLAALYEAENPGVKVLLESAGSVVTARKITELKRPCDIMASADYFVIDNMLIPEFAGWNIRFATNEMVICYHEKSRHLSDFNAETWPDIILKKDVIYSRADPNDDPCGYRTIFTIMLTEAQSGNVGLTDRLLNKDANYIRPKGIDLVSLLQSKSVDYVFEYKSIAEQHNLLYIELPASVNLSDPAMKDEYGTVSCNIKGSEPGKVISMRGDYILYSATILKNANNKTHAEGFMRLLLGEAGRDIFSADGQNPVVPPIKSGPDDLPQSLIPFFQKEDQQSELVTSDKSE